MTRESVLKTVLAALVILGVGVAVAMAETLKLKMERTGDGEVVTVTIDDVTDELSLDDLSDGEQRDIAAGEHTVTVRRDGDRLEVLLDGEPIGGTAGHEMVWMSDDGTTHQLHGGARKVIVMRDTDVADGETRAYAYKISDGELSEDVEIDLEELRERLESGETGETIDVRVLGPRMMVHAGHPAVFMTHGMHGEDRVLYRCEESGSELIVDADDALLDSYIDPATGCLMEKVETPEVQVITIVEEQVETDD
jgi:hypothetical protein